jgi:YHS domain-containing protein
MQKLKVVILTVALTAFAIGTVWADAAKPVPAAPPAGQTHPQTKCPVLGGDINKQFYTDYKGQRIYFCCAGCDQEFKQNPEKYLKKLKEEGVTPEPAPSAGSPQK